MERTWRWFGKKDKITLAQLKQIGVEGIVTALHDVPTTIWLNNIHFKNFLKELWNTLQKTLDNGNWLHR